MTASPDPVNVQELVNAGVPIDARQLAALLGCNRRWVLEQVKERRWPAFKPARKVLFTPEHVRTIQDKTSIPVVERRRGRSA